MIIVDYKDKNKSSEVSDNLNNLIKTSETTDENKQNKRFGFESILIYPYENYLILIMDWKNIHTAQSYTEKILQKIKR